ncbi:T9SS-dependent choice-of-anchor J family protein [Chryseobacterium paridis]|uniref:Choice-of-anchor J domain-containing protein n=1 Tax=Chryseobacterium paridis TaxID=2800328 RepID=A0ABS1FR02_9FLAO|nr:choice-of-anchor J domain-containing protein [Chryseobacterium paridis]MBK1894796.1 choice-of-anchor J domain-containing protein [Chryseobacterium paridis]
MKQIYQLVIVLGLLPISIFGQYTQSFDSATMPADWTIINGGDPGTWETWDTYSASTDIDPHSGSHYLGLEYGSTAHDDYAVSPAIVVTAGVSDKLTFWSKNGGTGLAEEFDVKISTTTPTAAGLTNTLASAVKPPTTWTQYTYDLSAYVGQTIYIAFYSSTEDVWFIGIDDFQVSGSLGVSEIDKKTASIYPNPVIDVLHIDSKNKMADIKIYDLTGRLQKQENINSENARVDLSGLETGTYIVRIKEGGSEKSYKIIKK